MNESMKMNAFIFIGIHYFSKCHNSDDILMTRWIDWFWLRGWLIIKGAICAGTAPLFWEFISLFERPQTKLVRIIRSRNQSISHSTQSWHTHDALIESQNTLTTHSCHALWVTSHSYDILNESRHTSGWEWVTTYWLSHSTLLNENESWQFEWVTTHWLSQSILLDKNK